MTKIVFDADALIKLVKAGLPKEVMKKLKPAISEEVYREVVVEGKKRMFDDASLIEQFVKEGILVKKKAKAKRFLFPPSLGGGEISSYWLYYQEKAKAIVSDDISFLKFLEKKQMSYNTSGDFIITLVKNKKLKTKQALNILENLKKSIKTKHYLHFKRILED